MTRLIVIIIYILIPGSEFIFCGCVSGTALIQGFRLGSPHVSNGRLHVGGPLGRNHHMRPGRHVMVFSSRPAERYSLADTRLSILASGSQSRTRRTLPEALQTLQSQQEAFSGACERSKNTQTGF